MTNSSGRGPRSQPARGFDPDAGFDPGPGSSAVSCPFCGSRETELTNLFGSSSLTSQYHCRTCRSAFERVRWGTPPPA